MVVVPGAVRCVSAGTQCRHTVCVGVVGNGGKNAGQDTQGRAGPIAGVCTSLGERGGRGRRRQRGNGSEGRGC